MHVKYISVILQRMKQDPSLEITHFTTLPHIWWGAKTRAGQKRYDNKITLMRRMCNIARARSILEVGCGDGEFTKRLARAFTGKTKIIAIDVTPKAIERASIAVKQKNVTFRIENITHLTLPNNSCDIICGVSILHHVPLSAALREMYRVLKPGGEIFFTEPNMLNPHTFVGLHIPYVREKMEFSPEETAFVRWKLFDQINKAKFKDIRIRNYDFLHPLTPDPLISLVEKISTVAEKIPILKEVSGSLVIYAKKHYHI